MFLYPPFYINRNFGMYGRTLMLVFMVNPIFSMKKDMHTSGFMQEDVQILVCNKKLESPIAKERRWLVIDKQKKADCYIKKVEFFALKIKRALGMFDEIIMNQDYSTEYYDHVVYDYQLLSCVYGHLKSFHESNCSSQHKNKFIEDDLLDHIKNQWRLYNRQVNYYAQFSEYYLKKNKKNKTKELLF